MTSTLYLLEHGKISSNVATYGVLDASGLVVGATVNVQCNVAALNVTGATITGITGNDFTCALVHANVTKQDVVGQVTVLPQWITSLDVEAYLGVPPATSTDQDWLDQSTDAANSWCYERRTGAGYPDLPQYVPGARVKAGAVMLAAELYRGRGNTGDSFVTYDGLPASLPVGQLGQVMRLLGLQKPGIG